jgi:precorrin-2 dehydrogenase/sirohydrochlorin ferrochelatase
VSAKYPALLNLQGRRCVVVGGGRVAGRKAEGLLEAGARVLVIAPELHEEVQALADAGRVQVELREYQAGDLSDCFLVIAATNDGAVNEAVWRESEQRRVLINTVDDPPRCNFYVPAVVRRGALTLAVSTDGKSCALAAKLRRELEAQYGPEYEQLLELLGELRERMKAQVPDPEIRRRVAFRLVNEGLGDVVAEDGAAAARTRALELLSVEGVA